MNLKERGITIGDLLIIIIIILASTTLVKVFNKNKETKINQINQEKLILLKAHINTSSSGKYFKYAL